MPEPPNQVLFRYIYGNWFTMVVFVYAELALADHIAAGAVTYDALARETDSDLQALTRVLDCARVLDLHTVTESGELRLTPTGELLRSDVPKSLRAAARLNGAHFRYHPWGELLTYARTGSGEGLSPTWEQGTIPYLDDKPETLEMFETAMSELGKFTNENRIIAKLLDWGRFPRIIDIGSGNGAMLEAVLVEHPNICGALFDIPEVMQAALRHNSPDSRLEFISGDFFDHVPAGFDAYLMKNILHNHPEEQCAQILHNISECISHENTRLFLFEFGVPSTGPRGPLGGFTDLNLNLLTGGSIRSISTYRAFLDDAGLRLVSVTDIPGTERIMIEAAIS